MTYASGTITSTTPAKDLMAALKAPLVAGGLTFVESYAAPVSANWSAVAYGAGVFASVANTVTAGTSADGVTWTTRALPSSGTWTSLAYGGGLFVATSTTAAAASSSDGITWTQRTLPSSQTWQGATYGGGQFVAVGSSSNVAATSPDGTTWTQRTMPTTTSWISVAYGAGLFVAISQTSVFATSPDGITWTQRAMPASVAWQSVTYSGGLFVAVANGTSIAATSPDGITWTQRVLPVSTTWQAVTYGGSQFVAVANGTSIAATSPDGVTWTQRTLPVSTTWQAVTYGAGLFVAVANATNIGATSPDGITWTQRALAPLASSGVADVYMSPAASNVFGQDWFFILRRATDTATAVFYQVAEQYNATTHLVSSFAGRAATVTPTAVTFANPAAASAPDVAATFGTSSNLAVTAAQLFTWRVSATANRVILGLVTSVEIGFYAGLYEDLLPAGTTQFPLMSAALPSLSVSVTQSIGGGTAGWSLGGFTREPGSAVSSGLNFSAVIHNTYWAGVGVSMPAGFTPTSTMNPLYGNQGVVSRAMVGSMRTVASLPDALRGLLYGCVTSSYVSIAGDSLTVGGTTYVRVGGTSTTYGFFVDQGL
jgi:hypothetical protein